MNKRKDIALWRFKLISPLLVRGLERGTKKRLIERITDQVHLHPSGKSLIVRPETLRGWLKVYRKHGELDSLVPKERRDKGGLRVLSPEIVSYAFDLKRELPSRSIRTVIDIMERAGKVEPHVLRRSTLWRHLSLAGLSSRALVSKEDFGRFEASSVNDLWQSDEKGPFSLLIGGTKVRVRIFGFEDDYSRLVTYAQGFYHGTLLSLEGAFKRAIQRRGTPCALYVDRGKVYLANQLIKACSELGISLLHAPPYYPEGKGKIERFWQTLGSFLEEAKRTEFSDLSEFNEALDAFIELRYNREPHSEIKTTPLDRFLSQPHMIRRPEEEKLREAFLWKENRKIRKDKTFRHAGKIWRVEAARCRDKVEIRYDPEDPGLVEVWIEGRRIERAYPFDPPPRVPGRKPKSSDAPISRSNEYLKRLVEDHRGLKHEEILSPKRFSVEDLVEILEREDIRPSPSEKRSIKECFERYGPFDPLMSEKAVKRLVKARGKRRHIREYLESIIEAHQRRKP